IGKETVLVQSSQTKAVASWSSDGRNLLFTAKDEKTGSNLFVLPLVGEGKPYRTARRDFEQYTGIPSPDNKWLVYESTDSGRSEIYVQRFSESGDRWQIS